MIAIGFFCRKKARTLYMCEGENETELSFEPNEIIENGEAYNTTVMRSKEDI